MLNTDLYLYPGEQIRTPSVALMFWSGDRMNGLTVSAASSSRIIRAR